MKKFLHRISVIPFLISLLIMPKSKFKAELNEFIAQYSEKIRIGVSLGKDRWDVIGLK